MAFNGDVIVSECPESDRCGQQCAFTRRRMLGTSGTALQYPAKSQIQNIFHMHLLAIINSFLSKMQQERNANGEDIVIEMTLKKFRSIHEPKPVSAQTNEVSGLNLPPLPPLDLNSASTTSRTLPHTASASRSRERRSNTVLSQVQGAFKVKPEEMMSGGINRAKFKCLIDNHLKKQKGTLSIKKCCVLQTDLSFIMMQILRSSPTSFSTRCSKTKA